MDFSPHTVFAEGRQRMDPVFVGEMVLRAIAGHLKPIEAMGTPPGAALNWVFVPVMAVLLILSLGGARRLVR